KLYSTCGSPTGGPAIVPAVGRRASKARGAGREEGCRGNTAGATRGRRLNRTQHSFSLMGIWVGDGTGNSGWGAADCRDRGGRGLPERDGAVAAAPFPTDSPGRRLLLPTVPLGPSRPLRPRPGGSAAGRLPAL